MSGPTQRNLKQVITYWAPGGRDQQNVLSYDAPVLIKGRWIEATENLIDGSGEEIVSKSQVFLADEVQEEGYLALGDFTDIVDPRTDGVNAELIQAYSSAPDLRYLEQQRKAFL